MKSVVALHRGKGWKAVQLHDVTTLQKEWNWEGEEYRVDVFFGKLFDGGFTPVVIMNVYRQGAGTDNVVDDNCDVWENIFTSTTKDEGNEYFKYLRKHGFQIKKGER